MKPFNLKEYAIIRRLILCHLVFALFLSGCASHPKTPIPAISKNWSKHQAQILAATHWQATAKLGIKVPNDGGSANLQWQQHNTEYQIALNGPLGLGKMIIQGKPGNVSFLQGENPPQLAKTAEELITKNTGWHIPVTQLAYWVRGLPAPQAKVTRHSLNSQGLLGELEQMGWQVIYGDYLNVSNKTGETIALPARITATYKEVKLTLVIREWQLNHVEPFSP